MSKLSGIFPFLHSQINNISETESIQSFFRSICENVNVQIFVFVLTNKETRGLLSLMEKYHFRWHDYSPISYKSTLRVVKEKCTIFAPFAGFNEILHTRYFSEVDEGANYAVLSLQEFARLLKDANAKQNSTKHFRNKGARHESLKELMRRAANNVIQKYVKTYIKKNGGTSI